MAIITFLICIFITGEAKAGNTIYRDWSAISKMDLEYSYSTLFYRNETDVIMIKGRLDSDQPYSTNISNGKQFPRIKIGQGEEAILQITNCAVNKQGQNLDVVIKVNNVNAWNGSSSNVSIGCYEPEFLNNQASIPAVGYDRKDKIQNGDLINLSLFANEADCIFTMTYYLSGTYNRNTDTGTLGGINCVNNFVYDLDVVNLIPAYNGKLFGGNEGIKPLTGTPNIYYWKDNKTATDICPNIKGGLAARDNGICVEVTPLPANVEGMWYKSSAFITTDISNSTYRFQYGGRGCGIVYSFVSPYPYEMQGVNKSVSKTKVKEQEGFSYTISQYIPNNYYGTLINFSQIYSQLYSDTRYNKVEISDQLDSNLVINGAITITNEYGQNKTDYFDISTNNNLVKATAKTSVMDNKADFYSHIYYVNIPVYVRAGAGEGITASTLDNRASLLYNFKNQNNNTQLNSNTVSTGLQYDVTTNIDSGGSITQGETVDIHSNKTIQITPKADYYVSSITINGEAQNVANYYTGGTIQLNNIRKNYNIVVKTEQKYRVTTSIDNGTITPGELVVIHSNKTIQFTPKAGYYVSSITINGVEQNVANYYTGGTIQLTDITKDYNVIVKTKAYGQVQITKRNAITSETLAGAVVGLYYDNATTSPVEGKERLTTGANGTILATQMREGTYYMKELQAPSNYTLNSTVQKVMVYAGQTTQALVENMPNMGKVEVSKRDYNTDKIITKEDTEFTLYEWSTTMNNWVVPTHIDATTVRGDKLTEKVVGTKGTYTATMYYNAQNLGKFKVVESSRPFGYTTSNWETEFQITQNGQIFSYPTQIKNAEVKAQIDFKSNDKEVNYNHTDYEEDFAQGDATLQGAIYGLYAKEDILSPDDGHILYSAGQQIATGTTDEEGKISWEDLYLGKYYIQEVIPAEGYLKDNTQHEVNLKAYYQDHYYVPGDQTTPYFIYQNQVADPRYENAEKRVIGKETVIKQSFQLTKLELLENSTMGNPLKGAGFKTYLISQLSKVKDGTIVKDSNGNYNPNDFKTVDFTKEQTALVFHTNENGERIPELFSNEDGIVISPELAYGKYVVIESTTPLDVKTIDPFIVEIKEDSRTPKKMIYPIDREFEARIKIIKKDDTTKRTVLKANASYRIWDKNNHQYIEQWVTYPNKVKYGTEENPYRTTEEGYLLTPEVLLPGEYELREVAAPEGYIIAGREENPRSAIPFTISTNVVYETDPDLGNRNAIITVEQSNSPQVGTITVEKQGEYLTYVDPQEGNYQFEYAKRVVSDAKFAIYAKEDIYTQDNQTDENGERYKIYLKDQLVRELETNAEGKAIFEKLPLGKYYVVETKAGKGFTLNTERKEVELAYEGQEKAIIYQEVEYTNERQKIDIQITKKDREEGTLLAGAEFGLYTKEVIEYIDQNGTTKTIRANQLIAKATSGENGKAYFQDENLPLGKYYVKELKAPKGYATNSQTIDLDCTYQGQEVIKITKQFDFTNQVIKLKIKIVDYETGVGLKNTQIALKDEQRNIIGHYNVDEKGEIEVKGLEVGKKYWVEEEKQRDNYVKDLLFESDTTDPNELVKGKDLDGLVNFTIKDKEETQKVTLSNIAKVGQIEIEKTGEVFIGTEQDEEGNLQFKYERQKIDTATFEIYTKQDMLHPDGEQGIMLSAGVKIAEGQTQDGVLMITKITNDLIENKPDVVQLFLKRGLPLGEYEIKETEAPKGYYYEEQTAVVKVEARDDLTPIEKYTTTIDNQRQTTNVGRPNASIAVKKEAEKEVYQTGEVVDYKITVSNTGSTLLKNIIVKESMIEGEFEKVEGTQKEDNHTIIIETLEIGEEKQLIYHSHLTQEEVGEIDNRVTATGIPIKKVVIQGGEIIEKELEPVTDEAKETIWSEITIRKIADKKSYKPGDIALYTVLAMNPYDEPIENATITDEKIKPNAILKASKEGIQVKDGVIAIGTIEPREKIEIVYQYQIPEDYKENTFTNTAQLNGTLRNEPMIPEEDTAVVEVKKSEIEITKEAEKEIYQKGEVVNYTIKVTNTGKSILRDIVIKENLLQGQFREIIGGIEIDKQTLKIEQLEIGQFIDITYQYTIGEDRIIGEKIPNKVTVTATGIIENPEDPENPKTEQVTGEAENEIIIKEEGFIEEQQLGVYKTDQETGEPIQGAVFGLYVAENIVSKDNTILLNKDTLIETAITDQNGFAKFKADLPIGRYYILEMKPAKGYIENKERLEIDSTDIISSEKEYPVKLTIQNKKTEVNFEKIEKIGESLEKVTIPGSVLQILEGEEIIEEWVTEEEPHNVKGLETEKEYILHEAQPAKGYVTAEDIKFTILLDGSVITDLKKDTDEIEEQQIPTVTMQDEVTKVKITVVDKETKEPIKDVVVQVIDKETKEVIYEFTTDGEEKIIEKIPIGDYEIKEKEYPKDKGYVSIGQEEFTIEDTPEIQEKVIEQDYTKLDIRFIDEISKELLPGGKLEIKNPEGETVIQIDDTGVHTYKERLPVVTYTIFETGIPEGYEPIGELNFTLRDIPDLQYVVIRNKRLPFDLKVEKYISEFSINGVKKQMTKGAEQIAKIEVDGKRIAKQNVQITYVIKVTNTGKVAGCVGEIVDRMPLGLSFDANKNPTYWKASGNKLSTTTFEEKEIEPGESIALKVILDWTKSEFNLGEKRNTVTIEGLTNRPGFKDQDERNNTSSATVLLAVKTGLEIVLTKQTIAVILLELAGIGMIVILEITWIKKRERKKKE